MILQREPNGEQSIALVDSHNTPGDPYPNTHHMRDALLVRMMERCVPQPARARSQPSTPELIRFYQFLQEKHGHQRPDVIQIRWIDPDSATQEETKPKQEKEN